MSCFIFLVFVLLLQMGTAPLAAALSLPELSQAPPPPGQLLHTTIPGLPGWGGNDTTSTTGDGDEVHWLPGQPAPTNDVVFSWCRKGVSGCNRAALKHGRCYDLSMLDGSIRAQLSSVGAQDGRCMLFQNYDCSGEHTAMFSGRSLWTKTICATNSKSKSKSKSSRVKWNAQAAAVRCCAGEPGSGWCNFGMKKPDRCTKG
ncbi:hypothetical protein BBK36DRAFT_1155954 [Trichoderma citrinoviride]|uniref:Uncharacterized protein n=1 Tax=Trichoderma citrinoviride TaxID=58853 RepID=A0A2T4BJ83_9HYPO|nr:hypothetical protein BBK36DRAFT_1155954 [Trichoderma citrinoviride]PTB69377.1 hypothetical protein BBK36DRAFT_1155954 [Trichoderma citrinoviride]